MCDAKSQLKQKYGKYYKKITEKLEKVKKRHGEEEYFQAVGLVLTQETYKDASTIIKQYYKTRDVNETSILQQAREDLALEIGCIKNPPTVSYTTLAKCGRCGARKASYYQMQTRSIDEPPTTFYTCCECNNRWKTN